MKTNSTITEYHLHKKHPEKLQFQIYNLNEYRKKSGDKAAKPHAHSYYQIIWFLNAGGTHTVDFKTYPIHANTIFSIAKGTVHAFDDDMEVEGWLIHFNESFFMHSDVDVFLKYNIFSSKQTPYHIVNNEVAQTTATYIQLMNSEMERKQEFGYEDVIRFSLKSLLIILERTHQHSYKKLQFNNHYELLFAQYKSLIEENFHKGLAVTQYADLLHISSKTLSTISKEIGGKSASYIIAERIILEAKRLLQFTPLPMGEIGFKIGIEDPSYFVKYFKRHVGLSPSAYRKQEK